MFPTSIFARFSISLAVFASCAYAGNRSAAEGARAPDTYELLIAEIALSRRQFLIAAREYGDLSAQNNQADLLQRAAEVTSAVDEPSLALRVAERWIAAAPSNIDARRDAALAALDLDQIGLAAAHCLDWVRLDPHGTEAAFTDIDAALSESDNAFGARQVADILATKFSSSPAAARMQGYAALRADDSGSAVKAFERARSYASTPELEHVLLRARVLSGDVRAADKDPKEHGDGLDYALLLLAAKRDEEAMRELKRVSEHNENHATALRLLGQLQFQAGNLDAATATFTRLLSDGRLTDDAFYYLGLITERRGKPTQALYLYARVTAGDDMLPALVRAAQILQTNGSGTEADELFDRLIEDAPDRAPKIWVARAHMYAQANQMKRALATLDAAIADYPDSVDLHFARASTYEDMDRINDAVAELRAVQRSRPDDPASWNALGYTLADHRMQLATARQLIDKAYKAAPQSAAIQDSLGWVLYRQGMKAQALGHLTAAFAVDGDPEVGAHLGEVLWSLRRHAEAEEVWTKAELADPDDRVLKATVARLRNHKK